MSRESKSWSRSKPASDTLVVVTEVERVDGAGDAVRDVATLAGLALIGAAVDKC